MVDSLVRTVLIHRKRKDGVLTHYSLERMAELGGTAAETIKETLTDMGDQVWLGPRS